MLTIQGSATSGKFCDRVSRRGFLRIGGLAMSGLALSDVLRAEAASGNKSHKSVIMIFLPGGPPHQDMYDLKPDAPSEIRGEFNPINTNVPGIQICELMPKLAGMMDKLVPIRSVVGATGDHYSFQCMTGRRHQQQPPGGWPEFGSVVGRVQGATSPAIPPYVGLSPKMQHTPYNSGKPGFLGAAYTPFQPNGEAKDDMVLQGISLDRLGDRKGLVKAFDSFNRRADNSGMMEGMDAFQQQAFGVLTSSKLGQAFELHREPDPLRDRYGRTTDGQSLLTARRLIEAGVPLVQVNMGRVQNWDHHSAVFTTLKQRMLPPLDQGVSALLDDLETRGMLNDTLVMMLGEFGRTPKVNGDRGRDQRGPGFFGLYAVACVQRGQVLGPSRP